MSFHNHQTTTLPPNSPPSISALEQPPRPSLATLPHLLVHRDPALALPGILLHRHPLRSHVPNPAGVILVLVRTPDDGGGEVGCAVGFAAVAFLEADAEDDDQGEGDDEDYDHCDPAGVG